MRVVFHSIWHMMYTTWPMYNIHPFAIFPTTFDLFQWLVASHNHIPTQYSTIFTHIEWEPVHWQRPIDGPPPTPCDTPTMRKALLVIKSHRIRISTETNFIVMELLIKNTNIDFYVTTYTCTFSMLRYYVHTPACTNSQSAGSFYLIPALLYVQANQKGRWLWVIAAWSVDSCIRCRVIPHKIVPPWIPHPLILTTRSHIILLILAIHLYSMMSR